MSCKAELELDFGANRILVTGSKEPDGFTFFTIEDAARECRAMLTTVKLSEVERLRDTLSVVLKFLVDQREATYA